MKFIWLRCLGIIIALGAMAFYLHQTVFSWRIDTFHAWLVAMPTWQALSLVFGLLAVSVIIPPLTNNWLTLSANFLLPFIGAAVLTLAGLLVGHVIAFWLSRLALQPLLKKIIPAERYQTYQHKLAAIQFELGLLYALPLFPVAYITWLLGAFGLRWKRFIIMASVGLLAQAIILTNFKFAIAFMNYGTILVFALVGFGVVLLLHWLIQNRRRS